MDFDLFNSLFYYDETSESGLRNKITRASRAKINNRTGCVSTDTRGGQCWVVVISGKRVLVHRIVYLLNNGSILSDLQVDHVDGNALNNNINNLRLVNNATNGRNAKMRSNNSTGVTGVSYRSAKKCYVAHYYINRKQENKCFSCKQYGSQQAFRLACEWRANAITAVNNELGDEGYTQRHGK